MSFWDNKKVVILGGAALLGSHLVDLISKECKYLWVADDLSSGEAKNIPNNYLMVGDLSDLGFAKTATYGADIVIHLACAHGGRTYVDTHKKEMYQNLALDATIFKACEFNRVKKVVFMSSACAYPTTFQKDVTADVRLNEDLLNYNNLMHPDGAYGFSKLAGELGLMSYAFDKTIVRGFTIYGPRMKENHAICALIAKSFIRQDPFEIYGDGQQKRNWTFVGDTVRGIKLATEKLNNDVVNIGTEEVNTPLSVCEIIWNYVGWRPKEIKFIPELTGPVNRIADSRKAKKLLDWKPETSFEDGVKQTIDWYVNSHLKTEVKENLQKKMFSR